MHLHGRHLSTVLFDLDGTLVDSEGATHRAVSAALADFGYHVEPEALRAYRHLLMFVDVIGTVAGIDEAHALEVRQRYRERYMPAAQAEMVPLVGADALLEALRADGAALALVTARGRRSLEILLGHLGWAELFAATVTADDAPLKPSPEPFHRALGLLDRDVRETVVVGDAATDIRGAVAAGISTAFGIVGSDGAPALLGAGASRVFESPADLHAAARVEAR